MLLAFANDFKMERLDAYASRREKHASRWKAHVRIRVSRFAPPRSYVLSYSQIYTKRET